MKPDLVAERWNISRIKNSNENDEDVIIVKWIYLIKKTVHIIFETLMSLVEFILPCIWIFSIYIYQVNIEYKTEYFKRRKIKLIVRYNVTNIEIDCKMTVQLFSKSCLILRIKHSWWLHFLMKWNKNSPPYF